MTPTRRILLFEDNYESLRPFKEYIEWDKGWEVVLSATPDVPDRLRKERFDLLLVDLMIENPGRDKDGNSIETLHFEGVNWRTTGLEFIRRLQNGAYSDPNGQGTPPDVPVIVLSAIADSSFDTSRLRWPPANHIEKPFRHDVIIAHMCRLMQDSSEACRA